MSNKTIVLDLQTVVKILEQIEPLVVSLDRIGSHQYSSEEEEARVVNHFSMEFDLAGRLSLVRRVLSEALDAQLDRKTLIEIEEKLEELPCWEKR